MGKKTKQDPSNTTESQLMDIDTPSTPQGNVGKKVKSSQLNSTFPRVDNNNNNSNNNNNNNNQVKTPSKLQSTESTQSSDTNSVNTNITTSTTNGMTNNTAGHVKDQNKDKSSKKSSSKKPSSSSSSSSTDENTHHHQAMDTSSTASTMDIGNESKETKEAKEQRRRRRKKESDENEHENDTEKSSSLSSSSTKKEKSSHKKDKTDKDKSTHNKDKDASKQGSDREESKKPKNKKSTTSTTTTTTSTTNTVANKGKNSAPLLSRLGGGNITRVAPVFSKDSKFMFVAAGDLVNVYSVTTGERVRCLQPSVLFANANKTHSNDSDTADSSEIPSANTFSVGAPVIALWLNPHNSLQIIACTADGKILVWDINDGVLLERASLSLPSKYPKATVTAAVPLSAQSPFQVVYLVQKKSKETDFSSKSNNDNNYTNSSSVYQQDLSHSTNPYQLASGSHSPSKKLFKSKNITKIAVSSNGLFVAALSGSSLLLYSAQSTALNILKHARDLTCIAFHPEEPYIATGDSRGEIILWYYLSSPDFSSVATSSMHWHANAVSDICFSSDGIYLLSGGQESVLVIWQLQTGNRQFLPRLGAPISVVSTSSNDTLYAVCHKDNSVRIVSAVSLRTQQVIQGIKLSESSLPPPTGIVVEPRANLLVLNSSLPGTIQFFDARKDKHIADIEIVPRHHVTSTPVVHVAFGGKNGEWMATVERREDIPSLPKLNENNNSKNSNSSDQKHTQLPGSTLSSPSHYSSSSNSSSNNSVSGNMFTSANSATTLSILATPDATFETRLRFWRYYPSSQRYVLSTCAESPHGISAVSAVKFHPKTELAVTCGMDKKFRVWALSESSASAPPLKEDEEGETGLSWFCRSVGFYRDYFCHDLSFSSDGSVLSIAYGPTITLWDVDTSVLQTTLTYPPPNETIRKVAFVTDSPYLVAHSDTAVYVWDLLTCSVWWSCRFNTSALAVDPLSDRFLVFSMIRNSVTQTYQQKAFLFQPSNPVPVSIHVVPEDKVVSTAAFVPSKNGKYSSIVYLSEENELKMLHIDEESAIANKVETVVNSTPLAQKDFSKSSPFAQVFAAGASTEPTTTTFASNITYSGETISSTIFSGPAHVIPPVSQLYGSFMELVLSKVANKASDSNNSTQTVSPGPNTHTYSLIGDEEPTTEPMQVDTPKTSSSSATKKSVPTSQLNTLEGADENEFDFLSEFLQSGMKLANDESHKLSKPAHGFDENEHENENENEHASDKSAKKQAKTPKSVKKPVVETTTNGVDSEDDETESSSSQPSQSSLQSSQESTATTATTKTPKSSKKSQATLATTPNVALAGNEASPSPVHTLRNRAIKTPRK